MSIPNIITIVRILLVPVVFWLLVSRHLEVAFFVFLVAGISDAADGFLAKRFGWRTDLGAYMDPVADKLLLVTVFLALGSLGEVPSWLVIAVVSRDLLIIMAFLLAWGLDNPMPVRPFRISKVNTAAQIALAGLVIADGAFALGWAQARLVMIWVAALLTVGSLFAYLVAWVRHMSQVAEPR